MKQLKIIAAVFLLAMAAHNTQAAQTVIKASMPMASTNSAWQIVNSGTSVELRGLSVVNKKVAWASGAKGTILKTLDGEQWHSVSIPEASILDFRDIQGFDAMNAIAMSAGPGEASRLYKTVDGGATWQLMMTNPDPKGFWDAMDFWDANNGIVFGDPVDGRFQVLITSDAGKTWQAPAIEATRDAQSMTQHDTNPKLRQLDALQNEGAFAASGTCLSVRGTHDVWFATGGAAVTRVFHSADRGQTWTNAVTPVEAGAAPRGLFSVAFTDGKNGFAVGGDYQKTTLASVNGARTKDGGKTWQKADVLPSGFLSVVTTVPHAPKVWVAGGLTGSGVSTNDGKSWTELDQTPINAISFADTSNGWAIGPKGLLMKYVGKKLK